MKFYQLLTEASQYIIPQLYKQRFFKKQNQLSRENIISRKVEPELLWLSEFLPKDAVFIDVGANVGHFIYQLEYHLFPQNIFINWAAVTSSVRSSVKHSQADMTCPP